MGAVSRFGRESFIDQDLDLEDLSGLEIYTGVRQRRSLHCLQPNQALTIRYTLRIARPDARSKARGQDAASFARTQGQLGGWPHRDVVRDQEALLGAKLVSEVDPLRILKDHRRIVSSNAKPETLSGILTWAFDVWEALKDEAVKVLREARIRVPTRSGQWIDAADALFSGNWSDEGRRLETIARELTEKSPDARALEAAFVADPGAGPFPADEQARSEWTKFLSACGVKDGLRPIPSKSKSKAGAQVLALVPGWKMGGGAD